MTAERRLPEIAAFGDAALMVTFGDQIAAETNKRVHRLAASIRARRHGESAWRSPVPGYASLLAPYDPLRWTFDEARAGLVELLEGSVPGQTLTAGGREKVIELPVSYGGEAGPDLPAVAERCGLSEAQVVELHASTTYRAYLLGFAPGFAYLGTLPEALQLPRRDSPRRRVPAGSVAIAGLQTAVYPLATPGGWHLLGRTEVTIWDPARDPAALIPAGSNVRFVPLAESAR